MVQVLHAHGIPKRIIASNIDPDSGGIDLKTLNKAFAVELRTAKLQLKSAMIAAVVKSGLSGNFAAQKFWLSLYGGPEWRIPRSVEDDDASALASNSGMTITIRGGLPPPIYDIGPDPSAGEEIPAQAGEAHGSDRQD